MESLGEWEERKNVVKAKAKEKKNTASKDGTKKGEVPAKGTLDKYIFASKKFDSFEKMREGYGPSDLNQIISISKDDKDEARWWGYGH